VSALAPPRRRIFGVDFSGARDAGKLIWVTEAAAEADGRLKLLSCRPARELPGGGRTLPDALHALKHLIASTRSGAFGCDFPFSLPQRLSEGLEWRAFVQAFPQRFAEPATFRGACMAAADGRELKRRTDGEAKVPFGTYNLRLYKQTFHGIGGLLAPLLGRVAVPPMQAEDSALPVLIEICPASTLQRLGLYGPPYKKSSTAHRAARQAILDGLIAAGKLLPPPAALGERILGNRGGDAVDSVVAAVACADAIAVPGYDRPRDDLERFEGRVYW
jgi:hypothetical protein